MAAAFHDDPSIRYLLGGEKEGSADWRYFLSVLKAIYGRSIMISADEGLDSLLVLLPPELKAVPATGFFVNGGLKLAAAFGAGLYLRSANYENNCRRARKAIAPDAWYCMCFVIAPEKQGRGIGSALIKPVLERFDENGADMYLETHKKINTRIYRHLGFSTAEISEIPGTDITQYAMLRRAK